MNEKFVLTLNVNDFLYVLYIGLPILCFLYISYRIYKHLNTPLPEASEFGNKIVDYIKSVSTKNWYHVRNSFWDSWNYGRRERDILSVRSDFVEKQNGLPIILYNFYNSQLIVTIEQVDVTNKLNKKDCLNIKKECDRIAKNIKEIRILEDNKRQEDRLASVIGKLYSAGARNPGTKTVDDKNFV